MRDDPRRRDAAAYPWSTEIGTRFGDLDFNFHLNNVAFAQLFEEGRVRFNHFLREARTIGQPRYLVARVEIDYLGEARYPLPVTLAAAVGSVGRTSWRIALGMFQGSDCRALCDSVMVHRGEAGPAPIPDPLRAALGEFALRG